MSQKRTSYSLAQKSEIIQFALDHQIKDACQKYKVHKSMLSRWIKNMDVINTADPSRKRLLGKVPSLKFDQGSRVEKKMKSGKEHRLAHILNDYSEGDESFLSSISTTASDLAVSVGSSSLSNLESDTSSIEDFQVPIPTIPCPKNTKALHLGEGPSVTEAAMTLWLLTQASRTACGTSSSLIWAK